MPIFGSFSTRQRRPLSWAAITLGTTTCLLAGPAQANAEGVPSSRIAHGKAAGQCALPAVVNLKMGNTCTGTLIHPQVILYAAHCRKLRRIILGENGRGPVITSIKKSVVHPKFKQGASAGPTGAAIDWAIGVLNEPVSGVPIIPLAYGGELEKFQKSGQSVVLAGFGRTTHLGPASVNLRWTRAKIEQVSNGSMTTVKDRHNACEGDSGGPVLVQLEDGSWRTIGITTNLGPTIPDCGKDSGYNRISQVRPEMIKWLEEQSGFDLTPCYDQDGKIDKSPACKNFFAGDIESPSGSWNNNCANAKVVKSPKLSPKGEGGGEDNGEDKDKEDKEAPKVTIKAFEDDEAPQVGDRIEIEIEVKDKSEIKKVSLSIDDKELKSWTKAPYTYTWEIKKAGEYTLSAQAEDAAGNVGKSEALEVTVDKKKKDPEEGEGDGGDKDDETSTGKDDETKGSDTGDNKSSAEDDEENKNSAEDESDDDDEDEDEDDDKQDDDKGVTFVKRRTGCSAPGSLPGFLSLGLIALMGLFRRSR